MNATALIAEDEPLLAAALQAELARAWPQLQIVATVGHGAAAVAQALALRPQVLFLDIRMPGQSGLDAAAELADTLRELAAPPAIVFVTAYDQHAVQAFELEAVDYLTKPVRLERLQQAVQKVQRQRSAEPEAPSLGEALIIQERGRSERVALSDIIYLKAELKYITVRTAEKEHIYDGALSDLEQKYGHLFVRVHRNALVARRCVRAVEKHNDPVEGEGWTVRLDGVDERLSVSRRQLAAVREALMG